MKNTRWIIVMGLVAVFTTPTAQAVAQTLDLDFNNESKVKLIEFGVNSLIRNNKTGLVEAVAEEAIEELAEEAIEQTVEEITRVKPVDKDSGNSVDVPAEETILSPPVETVVSEHITRPSLVSRPTQTLQCGQVQGHCLEISAATKTVQVYNGGVHQQTMPIVNGNPIVYTLPLAGGPASAQPVYGSGPAVQPVYSQPVYGRPTPGNLSTYPQVVYGQHVANPRPQGNYGVPTTVIPVTSQLRGQSVPEAIVINIEPKAEPQTIILDGVQSHSVR